MSFTSEPDVATDHLSSGVSDQAQAPGRPVTSPVPPQSFTIIWLGLFIYILKASSAFT